MSTSNNYSNSSQLVGITRGEVRARGRLIGFEWFAVIAVCGSPGGYGPVITRSAPVGALTGEMRRKARRWINSLASLTMELEKSEQDRLGAIPKMITPANMRMMTNGDRGQAVAA